MQFSLESTQEYDKWFAKLKDPLTKNRILARLSRVEKGNFGDFKALESNLFELRFFFGPGWCIYYTIKSNCIVLLLVGGEKSSQDKDIAKASELWAKLEE